MTVVQRFSIWSVVISVFIIGGFAAGAGQRNNKAIEPLIKALADDHWMVRDEATVALAKMNSEEVIKPLNDALNDKSDHIREQAAWILSQIKSNRVVKEEPSQA